MGMFDEFFVSKKWAVTMPCGCVRRVFQTKDLDCFLDRYEVSDDGTCAKIGTLAGSQDLGPFTPPDCAIGVYDRCAKHEKGMNVEIVFRGGKVVFVGNAGGWPSDEEERATLRAQLAEAREAARVLAFRSLMKSSDAVRSALETVKKWEG